MKILLSFLFIFSVQAAEITFEPYIGPYLFGTYSDGSSSSISGFGIGAKGGFFFAKSFIAGLELTTAALEADKNPKENHEQQGIGVFGGMIVPGVPIRAWMTFYPVYISRIGGGRRIDGSAFKLGLGISPFPLPISFNMEYLMATFDDQQVNGRTETLTPEASSQNLMVNVSFPLSTPL